MPAWDGTRRRKFSRRWPRPSAAAGHPCGGTSRRGLTVAQAPRVYAVVRSVVSFALRRFYRIERAGASAPGGPLLLVGNHPNALIDPALLIAVSTRPLTFLAKEPIFRMPALGSLVRALGALPVVRAQDDPRGCARTSRRSARRRRASPQGRAMALFPEGRSHSEPSLGALKTGAARLALRRPSRCASSRSGSPTAEKGRFRSSVRVEFGPALERASAARPSRIGCAHSPSGSPVRSGG